MRSSFPASANERRPASLVSSSDACVGNSLSSACRIEALSPYSSPSIVATGSRPPGLSSRNSCDFRSAPPASVRKWDTCQSGFAPNSAGPCSSPAAVTALHWLSAHRV
eukprot:411447-Prymnesium_polylepis.1